MSLQTNSLSQGNLYTGSKSLLGRVEEINLPDVPFTMVEHKALGMLGVPKFFNGIDALEGSIKWNSYYPDVAKEFANPTKAINLMFRGSVQNWQGGDLTDEKAIVTFLTIQVKKWPNGAFKKGDPVELQTEFVCTAIKQVYDGETIYEIDIHNNIFVVAGEDLMAKYRQNLGI